MGTKYRNYRLLCLLVQGIPCLIPWHLSLIENLCAKEGGKEETGKTSLLLSYLSFLWYIALHHHSSAFRACLDTKYKAPEQEAGVCPLYEVYLIQVQSLPSLYRPSRHSAPVSTQWNKIKVNKLFSSFSVRLSRPNTHPYRQPSYLLREQGMV